MKKIELLAPAKNLQQGIAALNAGADAVYIGGPQFGARSKAGNSISEIETLTKYAHFFNAKVYTTVNTIIFDDELEVCRKMIFELYDSGVDALIIQDMGILEMDLPPLPLHASTQTNNRDPEKIKFFEKCGFERVVLARELNLMEIEEIRKETSVDLEFFVAGSLCVSYSGNCYLSASMGTRSANRGECSQSCRLPFDMFDNRGNKIIEQKHLFSVKDLNLSSQIDQLVKAGISAFKIEGRLKDLTYIKNNVAFFRKEIDAFLQGNPAYAKASSGKSIFSFEPQPERSFNRGYTHYFIEGRNNKIGSWESPKSVGQFIGNLLETKGKALRIENGNLLKNGDGVCFFEKEELNGFYVNDVVEDWVFPNELKNISKETAIYRNKDVSFNKQVEHANSAVRKIDVKMELNETSSGFILKAVDEDGNASELKLHYLAEKTKNGESIEPKIKDQLAKTGNTSFITREIKINFTEPWFLPISKVNEWRRNVLEDLYFSRIKNYQRKKNNSEMTTYPFPLTRLDYTHNVSNRLAGKFYKNHGVSEIEKAFELQKDPKSCRVMTTKYCLKYEMDQCKKFSKNYVETDFTEPLFLDYAGRKFRVNFDCSNCVMELWKISE